MCRCTYPALSLLRNRLKNPRSLSSVVFASLVFLLLRTFSGESMGKSMGNRHIKKITALKIKRLSVIIGGSGEIRTHEGRKPLPVFKTGAFNHSATLPEIVWR